MNHVQGNDLSICLLDFSQLGEKVPESGFGNDCVGSEDSHAVEFRGWVGLGRQVAADDLVFVEATWRGIVSRYCSVQALFQLCRRPAGAISRRPPLSLRCPNK